MTRIIMREVTIVAKGTSLPKSREAERSSNKELSEIIREVIDRLDAEVAIPEDTSSGLAVID